MFLDNTLYEKEKRRAPITSLFTLHPASLRENPAPILHFSTMLSVKYFKKNDNPLHSGLVASIVATVKS